MAEETTQKAPEAQLAEVFVDKAVQQGQLEAYEKDKYLPLFTGFATMLVDQIGGGFKVRLKAEVGKYKQDLYDAMCALTVMVQRHGGEVLLTQDEIKTGIPVGATLKWTTDKATKGVIIKVEVANSEAAPQPPDAPPAPVPDDGHK